MPASLVDDEFDPAHDRDLLQGVGREHDEVCKHIFLHPAQKFFDAEDARGTLSWAHGLAQRNTAHARDDHLRTVGRRDNPHAERSTPGAR